MPRSNSDQPVLVTGAHRSGTTWVGKMLAASGRLAYISEPLNVLHRPGILKHPVPYWYTYLCEDNGSEFAAAYQAPLQLRYNLAAELGALRSRRDVLRMVRDLRIYLSGRLLRRRPLFKDPFAVFSAPWFTKRLQCQVVITVRHPAAFASSLKRLKWEFDFGDLLAQPLLLRDWLAPFQAEMLAVQEDDIIAQSALLWRMIYHVVDRYHESHPEFIIVRHEDLSLTPLDCYQELYDRLNLPFTEQAQAAILTSTASKNPKELAARERHAYHLDSQANLQNWKHRLSAAEIDRIRVLTRDVSDRYYSPEEWN